MRLTLPGDPSQWSEALDNNVHPSNPDNADIQPRYADMKRRNDKNHRNAVLDNLQLMLFLFFKLSDVFDECLLVDKSRILAIS